MKSAHFNDNSSIFPENKKTREIQIKIYGITEHIKFLAINSHILHSLHLISISLTNPSPIILQNEAQTRALHSIEERKPNSHAFILHLPQQKHHYITTRAQNLILAVIQISFPQNMKIRAECLVIVQTSENIKIHKIIQKIWAQIVILFEMMPERAMSQEEFSINEWTEEVRLRVRQMANWGVQKLYVWRSSMGRGLLKEMAHIRFTALTEITLDGNKIESIEGLPRMEMSYLQELNLNYFSGSNQENLLAFSEQLSIGWNHFYDGNLLTEGYIPEITIFSSNTHPDKFFFSRSIKTAIKRKWPHACIN